MQREKAHHKSETSSVFFLPVCSWRIGTRVIIDALLDDEDDFYYY
jgi:hypothetical protein